MKTTAAQKVKLGVFAVIGIGVLIAGIFIIGNRRDMFSETFSVHGNFKNVGGLQVGNNVRFAGINVGTVEDILIKNDTTVRVNMRLEAKVHPFLKSDAIASIGSDGLMGDKLVIISPGAGGDRPLGDGGEIQTRNPVDFDKIVTRLTNVADNAEVITNSLASISSQISSGRGNLGRLIYSDKLVNGLNKTVESANETVEAVHETMKSVKQGTEGFSENMQALKHSVLLRGYYKRKARKAREKADSERAATLPVTHSPEPMGPPPVK